MLLLAATININMLHNSSDEGYCLALNEILTDCENTDLKTPRMKFTVWLSLGLVMYRAACTGPPSIPGSKGEEH